MPNVVNFDIESYRNDIDVDMSGIGATNSIADSISSYGGTSNAIQNSETEEVDESKEPDDYIIHKPPHIIIHRPPTEILLHHKPIFIKRAPIVFHRPGNVIKRRTFRHMMPRQFVVKPIYYRMIKPIEKKVLLDSLHNEYCAPQFNGNNVEKWIF